MYNEQIKNKAITISAIMDNQKLFNVVSEALKAPLGSSKRDKATSILNVFNKENQGNQINQAYPVPQTNQIQDGKGGMNDSNVPYGPMTQAESLLQNQEATAPIIEPITPLKTKVVFPSGVMEKPRDKFQASQTFDTSKKHFYKGDGVDLINSDTGERIGSTDWEQNWAGKAIETTKPTITPTGMEYKKVPTLQELESSFYPEEKEKSWWKKTWNYITKKPKYSQSMIDEFYNIKTKAPYISEARKKEEGKKIMEKYNMIPTEYQKFIDEEEKRLADSALTQEGIDERMNEQFVGVVSTQRQQRINDEFDKLTKTMSQDEALAKMKLQDGVIPTSNKIKYLAEQEDLLEKGNDPKKITELLDKKYGSIIQPPTKLELEEKADAGELYGDEGAKEGQGIIDDRIANDPWPEYYDLSIEDQELFKPMHESMMRGDRSDTFAKMMMNDPERLIEFGIPRDKLPIAGASLAGQEKMLKEQVREETGLKVAEDNLSTLNERGLTLTDDLQGHINSQDKYIKHIDEMYDKAMDYMETIDMSLPENRKSMESYLNYLSVIKGRRQIDYDNFLNAGINYHNAELTRAQNAYDTARQNFTEELRYKTSVSNENYETIHNYLMDMYENINGREERQLQKQLLENEVTKSTIETTDLVSAFLNPVSGWSQMTESSKAKIKEKYIANSELDPTDAENEFNSFNDSEKLKASSMIDKSKSSIYVKSILLAEYGGEPSDYYTMPDEDAPKGSPGTIRSSKLPTDIEKYIMDSKEELEQELGLKGMDPQTAMETIRNYFSQ